MKRHSVSPCATLADQYQALLEVEKAISVHHDLHEELFRDLAQRLPRVVDVKFVALSLHEPARHTMRLHTIQANVPADLIGGPAGADSKPGMKRTTLQSKMQKLNISRPS
jgi:formate hydrogenlyase transcriptional activator